MGFGDTSDKVEHKGEEVAGKVKEEFGDATDNERLEAEGKVDQSSAKAKQAGDDVADALHDAAGAVKGMARDDDKYGPISSDSNSPDQPTSAAPGPFLVHGLGGSRCRLPRQQPAIKECWPVKSLGEKDYHWPAFFVKVSCAPRQPRADCPRCQRSRRSGYPHLAGPGSGSSPAHRRRWPAG
jgi:uncharacterized protein YjbJ (UPF0337 family)